MIFTFVLVIFLSISSVRNNHIDSSGSDSEEVHAAPDDFTKLSIELMVSRQIQEELPFPRIVIVGPTGAGKIIKVRKSLL